MAALGWDPSLLTGDATIDAQHRDVFVLIDDLACLEHASPTELLQAADIIMDHVDVHFAMEEDLMGRWAFPKSETDVHVSEHLELKHKARQAVLGFRGGWDETGEPVIAFLRSWLVDHIENQDRELVEHIRRRRETGAEAV